MHSRIYQLCISFVLLILMIRHIFCMPLSVDPTKTASIVERSKSYSTMIKQLRDNWQSPIMYLKKRGYIPYGVDLEFTKTLNSKQKLKEQQSIAPKINNIDLINSNNKLEKQLTDNEMKHDLAQVGKPKETPHNEGIKKAGVQLEKTLPQASCNNVVQKPQYMQYKKPLDVEMKHSSMKPSDTLHDEQKHDSVIHQYEKPLEAPSDEVKPHYMYCENKPLLSSVDDIKHYEKPLPSLDNERKPTYMQFEKSFKAPNDEPKEPLYMQHEKPLKECMQYERPLKMPNDEMKQGWVQYDKSPSEELKENYLQYEKPLKSPYDEIQQSYMQCEKSSQLPMDESSKQSGYTLYERPMKILNYDLKHEYIPQQFEKPIKVSTNDMGQHEFPSYEEKLSIVRPKEEEKCFARNYELPLIEDKLNVKTSNEGDEKYGDAKRKEPLLNGDSFKYEKYLRTRDDLFDDIIESGQKSNDKSLEKKNFLKTIKDKFLELFNAHKTSTGAQKNNIDFDFETGFNLRDLDANKNIVGNNDDRKYNKNRNTCNAKEEK